MYIQSQEVLIPFHDERIIERAESVTKEYDNFHNVANEYFNKGKGDMYEVTLYKAMMTVNILEGLRFYVHLLAFQMVNLNLWKVLKDYFNCT